METNDNEFCTQGLGNSILLIEQLIFMYHQRCYSIVYLIARSKATGTLFSPWRFLAKQVVKVAAKGNSAVKRTTQRHTWYACLIVFWKNCSSGLWTLWFIVLLLGSQSNTASALGTIHTSLSLNRTRQPIPSDVVNNGASCSILKPTWYSKYIYFWSLTFYVLESQSTTRTALGTIDTNVHPKKITETPHLDVIEIGEACSIY